MLSVLLLSACSGRQAAVPPPMMGWSSWNAFMTDISDTLIMRQADRMVSSGLSAAGYQYVNIDDGHFGWRDSRGRMTANPIRFPGGMPRVTRHIHALGLKAGIYSDGGCNTCGSIHNGDSYGVGAGLFGHDAEDADLYFNEWGFDYIKIDYCGGHRSGLDPKERYLRIRQVIDSVARHPVRVNVCLGRFPGTWVAEAGNSWRVGRDIFTAWKHVAYEMGKNLYLSAYAGNGRYNDMDMLVVGYADRHSPLPEGDGYIPFCEEEAHFGLWCIMASPLMLGCDLACLPENTRKLVTNPELIAVNQDPLGLQAHVVLHRAGTYVLAKDVRVRHGRRQAVALYNPTDEAAGFDVPAALLGYPGKMHVRDLLHRKNLGRMEAIRMTVPPHGARILSVRGRGRQDACVYEAEWGYIPAFNDIGRGGARYVKSGEASCGAVVRGLGGSGDNCLCWRDVWQRKGGDRILELHYRAEAPCSLTLLVNGVAQELELPATEGFGSVSARIRLARGDNEISLGNENETVPADIDAIRIVAVR
ncbi:MAG: alpha-galactosidase [Bacteroidales bacterium]|nr:alpha-galactosidase [Bacteroidales bacterium]